MSKQTILNAIATLTATYNTLGIAGEKEAAQTIQKKILELTKKL